MISGRVCVDFAFSDIQFSSSVAVTCMIFDDELSHSKSFIFIFISKENFKLTHFSQTKKTNPRLQTVGKSAILHLAVPFV